MRRSLGCLAILFLSAGANAGELEDVLACIQAAKEIGGVELDPRLAKYQFRLLRRCEATWPNAHCQVDLGVVHNLKIDGREIVVEQFPGRAAYNFDQTLVGQTEGAKKVLRARIDELEKRQNTASENVRKLGANYQKISAYVRIGIEEALSGGPASNASLPPVTPAPVPDQSATPTAESVNADVSAAGSDTKDAQPAVSTQNSAGETTVEVAVPPTATAPKKAWVSAATLNARTCGSTRCGVVSSLTRGAEVAVYETSAGWSRISSRMDATCRDGVATMVTSGNTACDQSNGVAQGKYAMWVAKQFLSAEKPKLQAESPRQSGSRNDLNYLSECRAIVRNKLKDPKSAQFRNVNFVRKRDTSAVCGEVNARTGFGGYGGFEKYVCGGTPALTVFESEVRDFANLWNAVCVR